MRAYGENEQGGLESVNMADASVYPPHVIAAHHEAGHGVGAVFLSVPFESISIEGEGSGDGSFSTQLTWGDSSLEAFGGITQSSANSAERWKL